MIPVYRSLTELKVIANSRNDHIQNHETIKNNIFTEDSGQRKRYIRTKDEEVIRLTYFAREKRVKWKKGREAFTKFFDKLDYNNQIQSSYDLTLLELHKDYDYHNAA